MGIYFSIYNKYLTSFPINYLGFFSENWKERNISSRFQIKLFLGNLIFSLVIRKKKLCLLEIVLNLFLIPYSVFSTLEHRHLPFSDLISLKVWICDAKISRTTTEIYIYISVRTTDVKWDCMDDLAQRIKIAKNLAGISKALLHVYIFL
jgi:hypothetical protein